MRHRRRTLFRYSLIALVLMLAAGVSVPFLNGSRFRRQIAAALQKAVGREVEIRGNVHFRLFPSPGLALTDVVIHEDPRFSLEPFAYVGRLETQPRLAPLWQGKLEFAALRLEDVSVNLLLSRGWTACPAKQISIQNGRFNFKSGDVKSVFYLANARLEVSPATAPAGEWNLQFSGEPARTDRSGHGFGAIHARGVWRPPDTGAGHLDVNVRLEKSAAGEILALVYGRDMGIHGLISSQAHLAGPEDSVKITGSFQVEHLHRWDQMLVTGETWPMAFQGRLNLPRQELELSSPSPTDGAPPLSIRFRVSDYLSQPQWAVGLNWNQFPAQPLLELARHMGAPLPASLRLSGTLDGAVGFSGQGGLQGELGFRNAGLSVQDSPPIHFEQARVLFDRGHIHLMPALVSTADDDTAAVEADFTWLTPVLQFSVTTEGMDVASLHSQVFLSGLPFLQRLKSGVWKGRLDYESNFSPSSPSDPLWTARIQLTGVEAALDGIAEPLQLESATAEIQGARLVLDRIRARLGHARIQGEYRYEPKLARPHRFRLSIPELSAPELERLLLPTLQRRRGLIARTLGIGATRVPDWLQSRHMDGSVSVGLVASSDVRLRNVTARVLWDTTQVELVDMQARVENGLFSGRLSADLSGNHPAYQLAGQLKSVDWRGGKLNADASIATSGVGADLLMNLKSEGSFAGHALELAPFGSFDFISGCYELDSTPRVPRLRLTALQLSDGSDVYFGRGETQQDGRLWIELSNGSKQRKISGTLAQLRANEPRESVLEVTR